MILGYNTNGLPFHRWDDAIELLADIGYRSVAITLDHHCLDPFAANLSSETARMRTLLERRGLSNVIETGARFLLNPRTKHEPTLMSATADERHVRIDFLRRAIRIAAELNSDAVSFWSGALRQEISNTEAWARLVDGCRAVCDEADRNNVRLAFEPEPGMFIARMEEFAQLADRVDAPHFGLTIDVGHVHCMNDGPITEVLTRWSERLWNIHIEDMCRGVHEHLRFGEGEIDFPPVLRALRDIGYAGGVHVELSRHGHMGPDVARESFVFLSNLVGGDIA